jgi:hypothetical protein
MDNNKPSNFSEKNRNFFMFGCALLAGYCICAFFLIVYGRQWISSIPFPTPRPTSEILLEDNFYSLPTSTQAAEAQATIQQITRTFKPTVVSTQPAPCIPFDQVGEEHVRRLICVYGRIEKFHQIKMGGKQSIYTIHFDDGDDNFIVKIYKFKPKVSEGYCIYITGVIKEAYAYYYMEYRYIKSIKEVPIFYSDQCD